MQAYVDGKTIEFTHGEVEGWKKAVNPNWDWWDTKYRVKPEPREYWILVSPNGNKYVMAENPIGDPDYEKWEVIYVKEVIDE